MNSLSLGTGREVLCALNYYVQHAGSHPLASRQAAMFSLMSKDEDMGTQDPKVTLPRHRGKTHSTGGKISAFGVVVLQRSLRIDLRGKGEPQADTN